MISVGSSRPDLRAQRRRALLRERMAVSTLHVLVVDENADDRRRMIDLLQETPRTAERIGVPSFEEYPSYEQITAHECGAGLAALEILRSRRIDVMFVDRLLPDMNGVDLISSAAEMASDTAVILMSRSSHGTDAAAAMKSGARDYLLKRELTAPSLHAAVQEAVRSTRLENHLNRRTRKLRRDSQRVGKLVQEAKSDLGTNSNQAEQSLGELKQSKEGPLKDLAAHFAHVEHSLRESRQFLAELTRLCDKAGWTEV